MYYYIFDAKKCKKRTQVEEIKNYLSVLGISGEYTYPTNAQSVEELVDLGISKRYNTIVGIGDDEVANRIANKLCGRQEAMGFVPTEASKDLLSLVGARNWKEGCDNLKFRKITEMHIGKTAINTCFITNVQLDLATPIDITLEFKNYTLQTKAKGLMVSNYSADIEKFSPDHLDIKISSVENPSGGIMTFLFGKKSAATGSSLIHARSLRIFTKYQIPLILENYIIAKTPQLIESSDEKIRIITAKGIITN
jgi:diacylglycerol kinase family enzyme